MKTRTLVMVLMACGVLRGTWSYVSANTNRRKSTSSNNKSLPGPVLPPALGGRAGRPVSLGPTERVLAARPGVRLSRRTYGDTRVALISTTGVKELHPPTVCLGATGHEVSLETREQSGAGCLVRLDLHRSEAAGTSRHTYYYTFFNHRAVTCSFWERAGRAAWARLSGDPGLWSVLQVMDRDPVRARAVMVALLQRMRSSHGHQASESKGSEI